MRPSRRGGRYRLESQKKSLSGPTRKGGDYDVFLKSLSAIVKGGAVEGKRKEAETTSPEVGET